jgi:phage recombination protein Bet
MSDSNVSRLPDRDQPTKAEAYSDADMIRVLQNSLYPGAKDESVALVLSYCRMNHIDPMLKPVHIVRRNVQIAQNRWEWRDVLMPGIADYRIKAARSGQYGGKSEPEFGPTVEDVIGGVKVSYPEWCKVTVSRIVQGQSRDFTAKEYWLENYANNGKSEAPNAMWLKRAFGQLSKCTESQSLRMAFPEYSGGVTAEEMEGKDTFQGTTLDHEPTGAPMPRRQPPPKQEAKPEIESPKATEEEPPPESTPESTPEEKPDDGVFSFSMVSEDGEILGDRYHNAAQFVTDLLDFSRQLSDADATVLLDANAEALKAAEVDPEAAKLLRGEFGTLLAHVDLKKQEEEPPKTEEEEKTLADLSTADGYISAISKAANREALVAWAGLKEVKAIMARWKIENKSLFDRIDHAAKLKLAELKKQK